jgi:hypothetical protein
MARSHLSKIERQKTKRGFKMETIDTETRCLMTADIQYNSSVVFNLQRRLFDFKGIINANCGFLGSEDFENAINHIYNLEEILETAEKNLHKQLEELNL